VYELKTGEFSVPPDFAEYNAKAIAYPNPAIEMNGAPLWPPLGPKPVSFGHPQAAPKTRKTLASPGKISMLQPETASLAKGTTMS